MKNEFAINRFERRSFACNNRLWEEISNKCGDTTSISSFIKQAILEKLAREEPEKKEYFEELI